MHLCRFRCDCPEAESDLTDAVARAVDRDSRVSLRIVRGLLDLVEGSGAARQAIYREVGLDPSRYALDDLLPRSQVYSICQLVIERSHEPGLGLFWACQENLVTFSPVSYALTHAPTLRDALDALLQLHPLFSEQSSFRIVERGDSVTLQCYRLTGASPAVRRFVAEMTVAGVYRLVVSFAPSAQMRLVSFEHGCPPYVDDIGKLFQRPVLFDQPFSGLVFDRSLMRAASPNRDEAVFQALVSIAKRRILRRSSCEPIARQVRSVLIQRATFGSLRMGDAARACGMSLRTLRRRLAAEGKSYQEVLNEALGSVAKGLVVDETRTLKEVSVMLGFDDSASFGRAFKRWTGMTPNRYRAQRLTLHAAELE